MCEVAEAVMAMCRSEGKNSYPEVAQMVGMAVEAVTLFSWQQKG
tara:strand:- start:2176 stop:2307 length:132 start_codon:yes stop_codon:yes gene_type:complete